jgi:hypothetical protein
MKLEEVVTCGPHARRSAPPPGLEAGLPRSATPPARTLTPSICGGGKACLPTCRPVVVALPSAVAVVRVQGGAHRAQRLRRNTRPPPKLHSRQPWTEPPWGPWLPPMCMHAGRSVVKSCILNTALVAHPLSARSMALRLWHNVTILFCSEPHAHPNKRAARRRARRAAEPRAPASPAGSGDAARPTQLTRHLLTRSGAWTTSPPHWGPATCAGFLPPPTFWPAPPHMQDNVLLENVGCI